MKDDSLERAGDIKGELIMVSSPHGLWGTPERLTSIWIFGKKDNHVPPEGRDLIRKTLHEKRVCFSFYEVAWAQRKSISCAVMVVTDQLRLTSF